MPCRTITRKAIDQLPYSKPTALEREQQAGKCNNSKKIVLIQQTFIQSNIQGRFEDATRCSAVKCSTTKLYVEPFSPQAVHSGNSPLLGEVLEHWYQTSGLDHRHFSHGGENCHCTSSFTSIYKREMLKWYGELCRLDMVLKKGFHVFLLFYCIIVPFCFLFNCIPSL